ncbi:hypothetical protein SEA_WHITNEY_76 [Gordonia phage Whitney]|nr:hypothetical protein SEA_WHITNEY_76 [Gordonia phage Whitney]
MPSDTPTPAEIAAALEQTVAEAIDGKIYFLGRDELDYATKAVIAALSEHYHLLPKAEPTDTYDHCREEPMVGWEIPSWKHFVRALDGEVQLEYDGEPEEPIAPQTARYFAAVLASAADVAEEQR